MIFSLFLAILIGVPAIILATPALRRSLVLSLIHI